MQSDITLTISINHEDNLPVDAKGLALSVTRAVVAQVFPDAGTHPLSDPVTFGRVTSIGGEMGSEYPGVQTFLQSAFMPRRGA